MFNSKYLGGNVPCLGMTAKWAVVEGGNRERRIQMLANIWHVPRVKSVFLSGPGTS